MASHWTHDTVWRVTATDGTTTLRYFVEARDAADARKAGELALSLDRTIPDGWTVTRVFDTGLRYSAA